jgi:hypothetical protein
MVYSMSMDKAQVREIEETAAGLERTACIGAVADLRKIAGLIGMDVDETRANEILGRPPGFDEFRRGMLYAYDLALAALRARRQTS